VGDLVLPQSEFFFSRRVQNIVYIFWTYIPPKYFFSEFNIIFLY